MTIAHRQDEYDQPEGDALLALRGIGLSYGSHPALQNVSLELFAARILVLMGPNGAGKSSLLRVLTGAVRPDRGETARAGRLAAGTAGRHPISLVPQDIALYSWLTAAENCLAFARIGGVGRAAARRLAHRALALTQCEHVAHVPVARLSGGYKRRINIAAALATEPALLVLDEPTAGVDLDARRAIWQILLNLKALGCGIVIVTHDFGEADALADDVAFLDRGRLVARGDPTGLLATLYGQGKVIDVTLGRRPTESETVELMALGLTPTPVDTVWTTFHAAEGWNADTFAASFVARGFAIDELRLRDPGIELLYTRFCPSERAAVA